MELDLKNISMVRRSKVMAQSCTAKSIEPCIINGVKLIIKSHRTKNSYNNEKNAYILLQNENFLPKLVYFDDKNLKLCITDVGNALPNIKNINLRKYEAQLVNAASIMEKKYNIFHNDMRPKNICIDKDNSIKLIDFDKCSNKLIEISPYYIFKSGKHGFKGYYF